MRKLTRKQKKILDDFFESKKSVSIKLDTELAVQLNKIDSEDAAHVDDVEDMITFQGEKYPTRDLLIFIEGEPEAVLISVQSLAKKVMDKDGNFVSDEAQKVDERVYFYVEDSMINLPDEELAKNLDEEFELVPDDYDYGDDDDEDEE